MPTPIDPKRLPTLKAALKKFGEDEIVSHKDLATLYGVTPARLTTLIHNRFENFPEPQRHGDKTHWYVARAAIAAMIAYMEGAGKKKRASAATAAAIMGSSPAPANNDESRADEPPPLGPAELDRLASASTRIWRLALEQGKFLPAADVAHWARAQHEIVKRNVQSIPHAIDPNGELPPLHRARLESTCREILVKLEEELADLLKRTDANERTGRATSAAA